MLLDKNLNLPLYLLSLTFLSFIYSSCPVFLDAFLTHICLIPAVWSRPISFPVSLTTFASFPLAEPFWFSFSVIILLLLLSRFSRVWLCVTPWTAAHEAPPSMGFSSQQYWSGVPLPSPSVIIVQAYWAACFCLPTPLPTRPQSRLIFLFYNSGHTILLH